MTKACQDYHQPRNERMTMYKKDKLTCISYNGGWDFLYWLSRALFCEIHHIYWKKLQQNVDLTQPSYPDTGCHICIYMNCSWTQTADVWSMWRLQGEQMDAPKGGKQMPYTKIWERAHLSVLHHPSCMCHRLARSGDGRWAVRDMPCPTLTGTWVGLTHLISSNGITPPTETGLTDSVLPCCTCWKGEQQTCIPRTLRRAEPS